MAPWRVFLAELSETEEFEKIAEYLGAQSSDYSVGFIIGILVASLLIEFLLIYLSWKACYRVSNNGTYSTVIAILVYVFCSNDALGVMVLALAIILLKTKVTRKVLKPRKALKPRKESNTEVSMMSLMMTNKA